jgi:hypothetical protein
MTRPGLFGSFIFGRNGIQCEGFLGMGRRLLSLLLFVAGYAALATLGLLLGALPALVTFLVAGLLLARETTPARI